MRSLVIPVCLVAILFGQSGQNCLAESPNVLFIAIDDLNDWIGCLEGHPQAHTPHIDRLAERGILFTNAHCAAPACNPSRAALFSGQMADKTGVWSNSSPKLPGHRPDLLLLPTAFREAGYATLGSGKLLHGGGNRSGALFDDGSFPEQRWSPFERDAVRYSEDELASKGTDDPRHVINLPGREPIVLPFNAMPSDRNPTESDGESFDWGPVDFSDSDMGDGQITDWAIEQIQGGFDRPFFLAVGYYRPHIPLWAPRRFFELFPEREIQLPPFRDDDLQDLSESAVQWALEPVTAGSHATVVRHEQWRAAVAGYLACISFIDHQVGRLMDVLDSSPYSDDTLIVLWSDHGWHLGEKQHWGKWTGWERSTRVPLMFVPPVDNSNEFAESGSRCDEPVGLIDIYPTLMEMCDLSVEVELDGESLVPLLQTPDQTTDRAVATLFDAGNVSLRTRRWRYIRYADGSQELYDHEHDPHEWNNLAGDDGYADVISDLRGRAP